ncbi:MAG: DUF2334 domain-containing protein [Candidatus Heimdallarchaeota archaeon]
MSVIWLKKKTVILSIHDVSPQFAADIQGIIQTLKQLDIDEYVFLVVPNYLGEKKNDIRYHRKFFQKILRGGEPVLHGYTHETTAYTNEYFLLERKAIHQRIVQGKRILQQVCGKKIWGFVSPKWILSKDLISVLKEEHFQYTTTFLRIIHFNQNKIFCPAINFFYTYSSLNKVLVNLAVLYAKRQLKRRKFIRIAIHPEGFSSRRIFVGNILKLARRAGYNFVTYSTLLELADTKD